MKKGLLQLILTVILSLTQQAAWAGTDMNFYGTLVDTPCTVSPDDTNIQLDFSEIIDKYLYLNTRTHSRPFTIHLLDCNIIGGETVITRFEGTESSELSGYLAMNDNTIGAAVGIEAEDGRFLGLNKDSRPVTLSDGSVALNFKAFVEGEPSAIRNKNIMTGNFSATATFYLDYP